MSFEMDAASCSLKRLLKADASTDGMYVRVRGKNLILGREELIGPSGERVNDDRVRLTRLNSTTYGLSMKRHTGRWERMPFVGTLAELVETLQNGLPHLVAPF